MVSTLWQLLPEGIEITMNDTPNHRNHSSLNDVIAAEIDPCIAGLKAAGYVANTLCTKRAALRQFVSWRRIARAPGSEPDETEIRMFLIKTCCLGSNRRSLVSKALVAFLEHLRVRGVIKACEPAQTVTASSALENRYADFLRREKGLAELSIRVYLPVAANFLYNLRKRDGSLSLRRLDVAHVRDYLLNRARNRSSEWVRLLAISLRSFLRFLHAEGEIRHDLTIAIPSFRKWAKPGVPKRLTAEEVNRVLAAPDRATASGRRDYAILVLLARLGLRSSEVLSLELGDIRWRTGELLVRGKGARKDLLPLPRDVGAAIASYLQRDRRNRPMTRIFLRTHAPRVPLTGPASIGHIVRRMMTRAGVARPNRIAAHLFRHTLASRMLQQGADLRAISEALRHRVQSTTEIYAKIDMRSLSEVVRPWPTCGGGQ